jgi:hypothetical protein
MTTYTSIIIPDQQNRHPADYYPTPPCATKALLANERFGKTVLEPACGAGDISKVLREHGYLVSSTDLYDYGYGASGHDFLQYDGPKYDAIITNPPFKHAHEFVNKALQYSSGKVAMFLRLQWLEGQKRKKLFESTPLSKVYIMSRRVPMQRGRLATDQDKGGPLAFAWFVWDVNCNYFDNTVLRWLDWADYV